MDKSLFKNYEEWCVKENKDPFEDETIREFKNLIERKEKEKIANSKAEKMEELVEKQREIFKSMAEYVGAKVKYDEGKDFFEAFDGLIKLVVSSVAISHKEEELDGLIHTILG